MGTYESARIRRWERAASFLAYSFFLVCLAFISSARSSDTPPPVPADARAPSIARQQLLDLGDQSFRKRADSAQAVAALRLYREAVQAAPPPEKAEALWRKAMACYFVGLRLASGDSARQALYAEGRDAGLAAIQLKPNCPACHFWTAINMALYGESVGAFKMFFSLGEVRHHLEETLRLDPSYAHGGAYRVLGLIEQRLPGVLGGSNERARDDFKKAIAAAPDEPLNYLFLAKLESKELGEPNAALLTARQGILAGDRGLPPERVESREALGDLDGFIAELSRLNSDH